MTPWLMCVGLVACGRIGFSEQATAVDAPGADAPGVDARPCEPLVGCADARARICGGVCVAVCGGAFTRAQAATQCFAWAGDLVRITDDTMNNCVAAQIRDVTWIGLRQDAEATQPTEGWRWERDGSAASFFAWGPAEPNDGAGLGETHVEDYAMLSPTSFWNDISALQPGGMACMR